MLLLEEVEVEDVVEEEEREGVLLTDVVGGTDDELLELVVTLVPGLVGCKFTNAVLFMICAPNSM